MVIVTEFKRGFLEHSLEESQNLESSTEAKKYLFANNMRVAHQIYKLVGCLCYLILLKYCTVYAETKISLRLKHWKIIITLIILCAVMLSRYFKHLLVRVMKNVKWLEGFHVLVLVCTVFVFHLLSLFLTGHQKTLNVLL